MEKPGTEVPGSRRNEAESREGRHMTHKYPNVLIHCVFSTKNREDLIPDELRFRLWKYFAGIGKYMGSRYFARAASLIMRIC
jgi:hypothetical protein